MECKRGNENGINIATELNQYGHNYSIDPDPTWLEKEFNNLRPALDGIYKKGPESV